MLLCTITQLYYHAELINARHELGWRMLDATLVRRANICAIAYAKSSFSCRWVEWPIGEMECFWRPAMERRATR